MAAPGPADVRVLWQDAEFVAVDKPARLPVHGHERFGAPVGTVLARLSDQGFERLHVIHRLDAATSGALLLARSADAARAAGAAFEAGRVEKLYLALVRGAFPEGTTEVDTPVPRDEGGARVPARTTFTRLGLAELEGSPLRERRYAWILASPHSGRFHQIRRHARHLGHPLIGDTTYGRREHNELVRERTGLARLALHASRLTVALETRVVTVEAELAADLARALLHLGL